MRSLADQTEAELGGTWSILVRQKRDHIELDRLLDELVATSGRDQEAVLRHVARLVFPHAFAEEAVLWPEARRRLPEGRALTLQVEQEHQRVNELWSRLEADDLSPAGRREVIQRLVEILREDVRDEEDLLLPRLQESVDTRRLRQLGIAWEITRRTAPTRPHPVVARRPPGNVLSALPLTLLDRTRDRVDAGARRVPRLARNLQVVSRGLGRTARAVERLGPLRRGEHPATHR